MPISDVVLTIQAQLRALGMRSKSLRFVQWDATTLKVSQGLYGALIAYDRGLDLYSVQGYRQCDMDETVTGVYAEDLARVVGPLLRAKQPEPPDPPDPLFHGSDCGVWVGESCDCSYGAPDRSDDDWDAAYELAGDR